MAGLDWIWATGRRKSSSAQVRIRPGKGKITINKREFKEFFPTESLCGYIKQPFMVSNTLDSYDVQVFFDE